MPAHELQLKVGVTICEITEALQKVGCTLIGHIKALVDAGTCGHLFFSLTDFGQQPRTKGTLTGTLKKADLAINVIVYGVEREAAERIVEKVLRSRFEEGV